jgi:hypothetical protein
MTLSATELEQIYDQVRAQQLTLADAAEPYSLDDIAAMIVATRATLREQLTELPDAAFEPQAADSDGNAVWSAGEVITHCNSALMSIGGRAFGLLDVTWEDADGTLSEFTEIRPLDREGALAAVDAADLDAFLATIPDGADLTVVGEPNPRFGVVPAKGWLMFVAIHEADHVGQYQEMAGLS